MDTLFIVCHWGTIMNYCNRFCDNLEHTEHIGALPWLASEGGWEKFGQGMEDSDEEVLDDGSGTRYIDERNRRAGGAVHAAAPGEDASSETSVDLLVDAYTCLACPTDCATTESRNACLGCTRCIAPQDGSGPFLWGGDLDPHSWGGNNLADPAVVGYLAGSPVPDDVLTAAPPSPSPSPTGDPVTLPPARTSTSTTTTTTTTTTTKTTTWTTTVTSTVTTATTDTTYTMTFTTQTWTTQTFL